METVIDFRSFDSRFRTALVFSIFEGLLQGNDFRLISDQDPEKIEEQFREAKVTNYSLNTEKKGDGTWEVTISKSVPRHSEHSCCGICGGKE